MASPALVEAPADDAPGTALELAPADAGERLTLREERIVCAMLEHTTLLAAAESLGLHRRTVERALARPQVAAALRARAEELTEGAMLRLRLLSGQAVEVLRTIMWEASRDHSNPDCPNWDQTARDRLMAARAVLELATRATMTRKTDNKLAD